MTAEEVSTETFRATHTFPFYSTSVWYCSGNQHEIWDCSFFEGSICSGPSSLGTFITDGRCLWLLLTREGRPYAASLPLGILLISIHQNAFNSSVGNVQEAFPSNYLGHHQHIQSVLWFQHKRTVFLPDVLFTSTVLRNNLFYFNMKTCTLINFV